MRFSSFIRRAAPVVLALLAVSILPTAASAHERRAVGPFSLLVGFNSEPAIQGQPNGAQLTVTVPGEDNRAVEGLATSLKATVAYGGGQPKEFRLRSVFGHPGQYVADFIPTRDGTYIFNFNGSIEGTPIDERFESGPGRFDDVTPVESLQFPETVPPANDAVRAARAADDHAAEASAAAQSARTVGMAGIGVGVIGILIAGVALATAFNRRSSTAVRAERESQRS